MRKALRISLFSEKWSPKDVDPYITQWGGKFTKFECESNLNKYNLNCKIKDNVRQKTEIFVHENKKGVDVLFEISLIFEDEDELAINTSSPSNDYLLPQSLISDIIGMGGWYSNGVPLSLKSNEVLFDEVESWWEDLQRFSFHLPIIVIGMPAGGDIPPCNHNQLAICLAGLANVFHANSRATMKKINDIIGRSGAPEGGIRLLLSDPIINPQQPLYTANRILELEEQAMERNLPRTVAPIFDIFHRLSFRSVISDEKNIIDQLLEKSEKEEEIEQLIQTTQKELKQMFSEIEILKKQNQLLETEIDDITSENKSYQEDIKEERTQNKSLIESQNESKKIWPILSKLIQEYELNNVDDLTNFLADKFWPNGDYDALEEDLLFDTEPDSVIDVLKQIEMKKEDDCFVILKSAFKSAKENKFTEPLRLIEAFDMLRSIHPDVRKRAIEGKSLDFERFGRSHGFSIANRENRSTMNRHGNLRRFEHNGKTYEMQAHVKIGVGSEDSCLRIHFYYEKSDDKFIIGHCGKHLPT